MVSVSRLLLFVVPAQLALAVAAAAQVNDAVAVTALRKPVDKPYRRILSGVELFEQAVRWRTHRCLPELPTSPKHIVKRHT